MYIYLYILYIYIYIYRFSHHICILHTYNARIYIYTNKYMVVQCLCGRLWCFVYLSKLYCLGLSVAEMAYLYPKIQDIGEPTCSRLIRPEAGSATKAAECHRKPWSAWSAWSTLKSARCYGLGREFQLCLHQVIRTYSFDLEQSEVVSGFRVSAVRKMLLDTRLCLGSAWVMTSSFASPLVLRNLRLC